MRRFRTEEEWKDLFCISLFFRIFLVSLEQFCRFGLALLVLDVIKDLILRTLP